MARPLRSTLILVSAGLGTALAAVGGWHYARASAPLSGPIVVISVDTLRADHLPAYGYQRIKTPAIDGLAANGIVFDRAYTHAPQTLPAHVSMLSGRLPYETGVRDDVGAVRSGERLLPQLLRERGYATAGIVSAAVLGKSTGIDQGFDFFDDATADGVGGLGGDQRDGAESEKIAEHWLDSIGTSRAFLFLHLYEPHKPHLPHDGFSESSPYDAEIAYSDEVVGRLLHYLKERQLYDRATIVLLSDHGEGLGDHGEQEHGLFVYDEAIRVPLIVKQENNAGAGRRVSDPVQHIDLVPTILDLVKAPISGSLRGWSLKPVLEGDVRLPPRAIYSEALYGRTHFGWAALTTVTDGRYRYIEAPRAELYDLERDPREHENLAARIPSSGSPEPEDVRKKLAGLLASFTGPQTAEGRADPKDEVQVPETYRRTLEWAGERNWTQAIAVLQQMLHDDPGLVEAWRRLAEFANWIDRSDLALEADWQVMSRQPFDPAAYLDASATLFKLKRFDEAQDDAQTAAYLAGDRDRRLQGAAHELLARIALAEGNADGARVEAELAQQAEPLLPMTTYVDARLLYDQGQYADALPLFERAIAALKKAQGARIADVHLATADSLVRLDRYQEAEQEFNEELRLFPQNTAARAGLAMLYQTAGDSGAAERTVTELTRMVPTPESYTQAAKLWKALGNTRQANAVRAEARQRFRK